MEKEELYGEDRLAAETRIRNLLWTVSGDYDLSCELDIDSFKAIVEPVTEWYIGELQRQGYDDAEELVAAFK